MLECHERGLWDVEPPGKTKLEGWRRWFMMLILSHTDARTAMIQIFTADAPLIQVRIRTTCRLRAWSQ